MRPILLAALLLAPVGALAQIPAGDPAAGRGIAQTWCSNCHVIDNHPVKAGDIVPSFPAIAGQSSTTVLSLQAFLQTPHGQMPNFQLSRQQIDDAIAYIMSLRK